MSSDEMTASADYADMVSDWKFVMVQPDAPKKTRRKRKRNVVERLPVSSNPDWGIPAVFESLQWPLTAMTQLPARDIQVLASSYSIGPQASVEPDWLSVLLANVDSSQESQASIEVPELDNQRSPTEIAPHQLSDFDRFVLLSNQGALPANTVWSALFGREVFLPATPLITSPVESSLLHFYAHETVRASTAFYDPADVFQDVRVALALSEPVVYHAALAVASAHWANRLRTVRQQNSYSRSDGVEWQLEVLKLALPYHRGLAEATLEDLDQRISPSADREGSQHWDPTIHRTSELRAVATMVFDSWQTYTDGLQFRPDTIRKVRSVLVHDAWSSAKSRESLYLRAWLMWVDTLDSAAQCRARISPDEKLSSSQQIIADRDIQRLVGCSSATLRMIASVTRLATQTHVTSNIGLARFASSAARLHQEIISSLEEPRDTSEEAISRYIFGLATHLYFLTSVQQARRTSSVVQYTVEEIIKYMDRISNSRQAWGTWPYLILGDHVTRPAHRKKVIRVFTYLEDTLSIGNLSTLKAVLSEVWDRRDKGEEVTWQE